MKGNVLWDHGYCLRCGLLVLECALSSEACCDEKYKILSMFKKTQKNPKEHITIFFSFDS